SSRARADTRSLRFRIAGSPGGVRASATCARMNSAVSDSPCSSSQSAYTSRGASSAGFRLIVSRMASRSHTAGTPRARVASRRVQFGVRFAASPYWIKRDRHFELTGSLAGPRTRGHAQVELAPLLRCALVSFANEKDLAGRPDASQEGPARVYAGRVARVP